MGGLDRRITAGAAAFLLVFGFLPIANWIPGGHSAPWFAPVAEDLITGLGLAAGIGVLAAMLLRKLPPSQPEGPATAKPSRISRHWTAWVLGLALAGLLGYVLVARAVYNGRPLLIDEIIQVFQARLLASGRLWISAEPHQFFFSSLHLVEQGGRVYGQFPMGGPAMLALGSRVGAEWLVGPVFGALSVVVFGGLVRRLEPRPRIALGATALFALAPFAAFMAGSHMNHGPTLFWLLVGMVALTRATAVEGRFRDGLLCGLGFGIAATIRPADAAAFAVPAAVWLVGSALRGGTRRVAPLLGAGLGIALPLLALAWANLGTTGAPLRFGYTVLWGRAHDLGFHATPWGPTHTPARGLELVNLYFLRLQTYLFEAAAPSLIPATAALALTRRLTPFDRYLLGSSAMLVGLYFAYWHDGFYLGPRFLYPLLPALVLWTARCPGAVRDRLAGGRRQFIVRVVMGSLVAGAVLGIATSLRVRIAQYRGGLVSLKWNADRAAERAGVRNALVLVRESWGAELVARMWALGVPRADADAIYRAADPCRLDLALGAVERDGLTRGAAAAGALAPLRADSTGLVSAAAITGDPSLRLTPGAQYPARCNEKLAANRSGFTLFPPLLLARKHGNLYARDLGARDSLLLREYRGRPVYLLKPVSGAVGAEPVFQRLREDSLLTAWRGERR